MSCLIVYDCEFLTAPGAPQRFWCGPTDPDPVIAQIGAVKLSLCGAFDITQTLSRLVRPVARDGSQAPLDPLFTRLTGITEEGIRARGVSLQSALQELDVFSEGQRLWSWGKDEFNLIAISCYVAGIAPPLPVTRFGNACDLLLRAGMPQEDIHKARSNTLSQYFDLSHPPLTAHDARDDALCVAYTLQHLLREGRLLLPEMVDLCGAGGYSGPRT